jgi:hypothetical protein
MSLSTNYKINGTPFSSIFDTSIPRGTYITNLLDNNNDIGSLITNKNPPLISTNTNYINKFYVFFCNWTSSNSTVSSSLWYGVSISSTGQYAIACDRQSGGKLYYSSNSGSTWTSSNSTVSGSYWFGVSISSTGQYAIASDYPLGGKLYYSSNSGSRWTSSPSTVSDANWYGVSISSTGQYAVACDRQSGGKLYYSSR